MDTLIVSVLVYLVGITLVALVIMQRKEASATLAWLLVITSVPFVGVVLYLWFGVARVERRVRLRQRRNRILQPKFLLLERALTDYRILPEHTFASPVQEDLVRMSRSMQTHTVTHGNSLTLLASEDDALEALAKAIQEAKDSVHLEFYIFHNDATGRRFRDLLIEAGKRGVEVRLLVDGIGSWLLGRRFARPLRAAGMRFAKYLPVTFLGRPWHVNLRNHRKIAIIDGVTAFFGSKNLDSGFKIRRGKQRRFTDMMFSCSGPIARELQEVFASDWFFATGENLTADRYFPLPLRTGASMSQVVTSGPDEQINALYEMLCTAIHAARQRVRITTPYLIPDQALTVALRTAALRGVQVQIITARSAPNLQELIALTAGQSYYDDLLQAGIEIYEYCANFIHAKGMTVDGSFASVGTANFDMRSFRLNFEVNVNIYSPESVAIIDKRFDSYLRDAERIDAKAFANRRTSRKIAENTLRVLSPIL